MKLIHISDLYGDLAMLDNLTSHLKTRQDIEAVVCSGNLAGPGLNLADWKNFMESKRLLGVSARNRGMLAQISGFWDLATRILDSTLTTPDEKVVARAYLNLRDKRKEEAKRTYEQIAEKMDGVKQKFLTAHSQWDMPWNSSRYGDLASKGGSNLHRDSVELGGVRFAGYGGANFNGAELETSDDIYESSSAAAGFLAESDPDVAVVHFPPLGFLDRGVDGKNYGVEAYNRYMKEESPLLVLCGGIHSCKGVVKVPGSRTYVVNAGNFGKHPSFAGGNFYEIDVDRRVVNSAIPYVIAETQIFKDKNFPAPADLYYAPTGFSVQEDRNASRLEKAD